MKLTLNPGFVYIFANKNVPDVVKIGRAESVDARIFIQNVADRELRLHASHHFLDVASAEAHMYKVFEAQHLGKEHFKVSAEAAAAELCRLFESLKVETAAFAENCRKMADTGHLKFDKSEPVDAGTGSALAALLSYVPSKSDTRDVRALVSLALASGPAAETAKKLLSGCGLIPYPVEGVVLLDKSNESNLSKAFETTPFQNTWRAQVSEFSGFNEAARAVGLVAWLDETQAGCEVVDKVSPLVMPA